MVVDHFVEPWDLHMKSDLLEFDCLDEVGSEVLAQEGARDKVSGGMIHCLVETGGWDEKLGGQGTYHYVRNQKA